MNQAERSPGRGERTAGGSHPSIDATASQWAIRRGAGLDDAGERELGAWLAQSPAHAEAFARLSAMSAVFRRARLGGATPRLAAELQSRARRRRIRRRGFAGAGAALALALVAVIWLRPRSPAHSPASLLTAQATAPIQRLADGSTVELNAGSQVAVEFEPAVRRVELIRGEAFFHVAKNPARPFIVRARGVDVRAVGTAFSVRLDSAAVEVLVTEGRVGVNAAGGAESLLPRTATGQPAALAAGQRAVLTANDSGAGLPSVQITRVTADEMTRQLAWRTPRLEFDRVELAQAVEQLNRLNRLQITIADDSIGKLRVSGAFRADDPATFSRLMAETFGLASVRRSDGEIVLRKK